MARLPAEQADRLARVHVLVQCQRLGEIPHRLRGLGERDGTDVPPIAGRPRGRGGHLEYRGARAVADVEHLAGEPALGDPQVGVREVVRVHHRPAAAAVANHGGRLPGGCIGEPGSGEAARSAVHAAGPDHEPAHPRRLQHQLLVRRPPRGQLDRIQGRRLVHHAVARVAVHPGPARENEGLGSRAAAPRLDQRLDRLLVLGDAVRRVLEGRMDERGALGGDIGVRLGISQVAYDGLDLLLREPPRLRLASSEAPNAMPCPAERRSDAPAHVPGGTSDEHLHWEAPVEGCLYNFNGAGPRARVTLDPQGAPMAAEPPKRTKPDSSRALRDHVLELLGKGHAHVTFEDAIAAWPAELRGAKPAGQPFTPWRVLEHIRISQWDIVGFTKSARHVSPEWPAGYWPERDAPPDAAAWDKSVAQVKQDLRAMQRLVRDPATDLFARIPHGTGQTVLREALVLADHNSYHLGQLVLLRRLLGAWKGD